MWPHRTAPTAPPLPNFLVLELWEFFEVHTAKLCVELLFAFGFSTCTCALLHRVTPAKAVPTSKTVGFLSGWDVNAGATICTLAWAIYVDKVFTPGDCKHGFVLVTVCKNLMHPLFNNCHGLWTNVQRAH